MKDKLSVRSCFLRRACKTGLTIVSAASLLMALPLGKAHAEPPVQMASAGHLSALSIEDLMQIEVYSAAKQVETVFTTSAAIYVITAEDIRNSGVTSLADALRLAPGVQVARIDGNKWSVGIRGFAGRFATKLMVIQDGRTLYNSLFSGVYWNVQEPMLEDIEQIEIIRGPAATLWGVNAVNGVINITTKHAKDTTGGIVTASVGSEERASTAARYGAKIGDNGYFRIYGKYFYRDAQFPVDQSDAGDSFWNEWRGGFRGDWDINVNNKATLQGDAYTSRVANYWYNGQNILGRWQRTLSDTSNMSVQLFFDQTTIQNRISSDDREARNTGDIELQHVFTLGSRNHLIWGTGYRLMSDQLNENPVMGQPTYSPPRSTDQLFTAFVQDKITLLPDTLYFIVGSRVEHNETTGWEVQPTGRLLLTPSEQHTLWGAVSRAVRTPSRAEKSISTDMWQDSAGNWPHLNGNPNLPAENMIAYEGGYRYQPLTDLSFDLALFYNDYSSLVGVKADTPSDGGVQLSITPTATAISKGGELAINWRPLTWTDFVLAYSYLDMTVNSTSSYELDRVVMYADTAPSNQVSLKSVLTLPEHVKCTLWFRYVSGIHGSTPVYDVSDYGTLDARIAWKPVPDLELSVVGQNLFEPNHYEFGQDVFGNLPAQVRRSVYGKVTWAF